MNGKGRKMKNKKTESQKIERKGQLKKKEGK